MNAHELALFAPLTVGATLGPATVVSLDSGDGTLAVHVTFGTQAQTFRVARTAGTATSMHLRTTGPFTVYLVGDGHGTSPAAIDQAWHALEAIVARHTTETLPPDLRPCCP